MWRRAPVHRWRNRSLKALEIRDEVIELLRCHLIGRHVRARLERLWIDDPSAETSLVVDERQVRTGGGIGIDSRDCVTIDAGERQERLTPAPLCVRDRLRCSGALVLQ